MENDFWKNNCEMLKLLMLNADINNFLNWGIIQRTMCVRGADYIKKEFEFMSAHEQGKFFVMESPVGNPTLWEHWKTSENLIHQGYHLAKFEEITCRNILNYRHIMEFGGGYGCMRRLFHKLVGWEGQYYIYDFPEFHSLQSWYLQQNDIHDTIFVVREYLDQFKEQFFQYNRGPKLFVSLWGISEASMDVKDLFTPIIAYSDAVLIGFQHSFEGMNNLGWIKRLVEIFGGKRRWMIIDIDHLPGNSYLFGIQE